MFKRFETRLSSCARCAQNAERGAELDSFTSFYVCMFKMRFIFVRSDIASERYLFSRKIKEIIKKFKRKYWVGLG